MNFNAFFVLHHKVKSHTTELPIDTRSCACIETKNLLIGKGEIETVVVLPGRTTLSVLKPEKVPPTGKEEAKVN